MNRLVAGIMLAAVLVLVFIPAAAAVGTAQRVAELLAQPDAGAAKSELFSIIAENPDDSVAWLGMARVCAKLELWTDAAAAFKRADALEPLDDDARTEYSAVLEQTGDLKGAYAQLKLATSGGHAATAQPEQPAEPEHVYLKPAIEKATAPKKSPVATPKADPPSATKPKAAPAVKESKVSKAKPAAEAEAVPATQTSWREIAPLDTSPTLLSPAEPSRTAQHESEATVAVLRDPRPAPVVAQNADNLVRGGTAAAKKTEEQPAEAVPADPLEAARYYSDKKRWAEAIQAYQQVMQQGPVDDSVRYEFAEALLEGGDLTAAESEYNRLLHNDAENIDAKLGLAKVLAKQQKITEAMYLLDQIFVTDKTYAKVQLTRAYIYFVNDYVGEAITMIGEVQGHEPDNAQAAAMLEEYTKVQDAQRGWDQPGPLPDDPALRAEALYGRGDTTEAKQQFEKTVKADPSNTNAWKRLADLYRWDEQWEDAADAYVHYLRLKPDDSEARLQYAAVLTSMGDCAAAADELWSLISDPNTQIETYNAALMAYATALSACGQRKEALTWYEQALRFDPHNAGLRTAYAGTLAGLRRFADARIQYEMILDEDPSSEAARIGIAQTYAWSGDQKKARKYYDGIAVTSNYYAASRIGKAYSYLWEGDHARAKTLADEAARLDPQNPDLPALYTRLGERPDNVLVTTWQQRHDSEDNDYRGVTGTLQVPLDARGTMLNVQHEDFKLDNTTTGKQSNGTNTTFSLRMPLGSKAAVSGSASYLDVSNGADPGVSKWNWSGSTTVDLRDWWTAGLSYNTQTLYETPQLARNNITLKEWALTNDWRLHGGTVLTGRYSHGEFSDNNSRESWYWRLARKYERENVGRFDYGVDYRTLDYTYRANHGYWSPDNYRIYEAYVDYHDTSQRKLKFDGGLGWGFQKDSSQGFSNVFRYNFGLRYGWHDGKYNLRAGYSSSDAYDNATAGPGYRSKQVFLTGDLRF